MKSTRGNWMVRWKRHYDDLSSPYAIRRYYDRAVVETTYNIIMAFWGNDFFEFDFLEKMRTNELHFVQALVFRPSVSAFYRLAEVSFLLDYADRFNKEQYRLLTANKHDSEKVKDILCEVLLQYAFREAGIPYEANPMRGGQVLEGYCTLNGERFLVESKNKYSMKSDDFQVICYVTARLMEFGRDMQTPNLGVGYIYFKHDNITEKDTHKMMAQLIEYLGDSSKVHLGGVFEDEHLRVVMKAGTAENYYEYHVGKKDADVDFFFKNTYELNEKQNLIFNMHVGHRNSARKKDLVDRLMRTLKKARDQHKSDTSRGRIFCIFNEFLNDFQPPLLVDSEEFVKDVSQYLASKTTDDIVILIDRRFNLSETFIKPHIMGHDHLLPYKRALWPIDYSIRRYLYGKVPF